MPLHIVIASLSPWICTKSHGFSPMLVVPRVSAVFLLSVVAGPCTAPQVRLAVNALTRCHRIVVPLDSVAQEAMAPRSCSSFRSTSSPSALFALSDPYPLSHPVVIRPLLFLHSHLLSVCAVLVPSCVVSVVSLFVLIVVASRFCPLSQ
jgi:hypothetical protein